MGPEPRKVGAPKVGAPKGWGPEGWEAQNFALFFPSLTGNFIHSSLSGGFLVEFWWCLKRRDAQMCAFGVLWLSCEAPAARSGGATGVPHDNQRAQTCTFERPGLQKHHQNSTRRPPERDKKSEMVAGERKKSEILGYPGEGPSGGGGSGGEDQNTPTTHTQTTTTNRQQQATTGNNRQQQPGKTTTTTTTTSNNNQEQTTTKTMTTTTIENLAKELKHPNWPNAVWPNAGMTPGNWCWRIKTKQKVMRENILTPTAQGNLRLITRIEKHETHEPSLHEQDYLQNKL